MTLEEIDLKIRNGQSLTEFAKGGLYVLDLLKSEPDFTLRGRVENLAQECEALEAENMLSVETAWVERRLRELVEKGSPSPAQGTGPTTVKNEPATAVGSMEPFKVRKVGQFDIVRFPVEWKGTVLESYADVVEEGGVEVDAIDLAEEYVDLLQMKNDAVELVQRLLTWTKEYSDHRANRQDDCPECGMVADAEALLAGSDGKGT